MKYSDGSKYDSGVYSTPVEIYTRDSAASGSYSLDSGAPTPTYTTDSVPTTIYTP